MLRLFTWNAIYIKRWFIVALLWSGLDFVFNSTDLRKCNSILAKSLWPDEPGS